MNKTSLFFKAKVLFLSCFFLPLFVYGLHEKDCKKLNTQAIKQESEYHQLVKDSLSLRPHERKKQLELLKEARECCRKAIENWNTILEDIASQPKKKRQKTWRIELKSSCEEGKKKLERQIPQVETEINRIEGSFASNHATEIYQKAIQKATEAATLDRGCERDLLQSDKVIATLKNIAKLYEEAIDLFQDALSHISSYPSQQRNQEILKEDLQTYKEFGRQSREELANWPNFVQEKKTAIKEKVKILKEDSQLLAEKGLQRACYDLQKLALPLLKMLLQVSQTGERESFEKSFEELESAILDFEKKADANRLMPILPLLSQEEFKKQEQKRKEFFFKSEFFLDPNLFLLDPLINDCLPRVVPLDGQMRKKEKSFSLYTDQFYRFLIENSSEIPEISITVYEEEKALYVETITLPFEHFQGLESLLREGMIFSPETSLKSQFGLDLRFSFFYTPKKQFSMIVSQKIADPRYHISLSLGKDSDALYKCDFLLPPPWQLGALRKPGIIHPNQRISPSHSIPVAVLEKENVQILADIETKQFKVLDQLVEELKKDPLALAGYVQNEIAFSDSFLCKKEKIFYAARIHRSPELTYLQKEGNALEQCHLLVYLLQKAGYDAVYALADFCSLPKDFAEKMLFTQLGADEKEAQLKYPAVLFFDGKQWISLFPWIKEIQICEGYDLYQLMPEDFTTSHRWMLSYLKSDENILKHIGFDGDDSAGILFIRSVEEELIKQGLSLNDIGIERIQVKKQFSSWHDFPRPSVHGSMQIYRSLQALPHGFALAKLSIKSRQNPQKIAEYKFPLVELTYDSSVIRFLHFTNGCSELELQIGGTAVAFLTDLDASDLIIDVSLLYEPTLNSLETERTFSIANGTRAALCLHLGGSSPKLISEHYERFSKEESEGERLEALLAFVGASYFEKCSRIEKILADLHKVRSGTVFAFGLSKLSPAPLEKHILAREDLRMPQVDAMWFRGTIPDTSQSCIWHQELYSARSQLDLLCTLDSSSNEHQILREIFNDPYAVSTVKLLQLAHLEHVKKGGEGEGFFGFGPCSFELTDQSPERGETFEKIKNESGEQWEIVKKFLDSKEDQSHWCFAYMIPGMVSNQNDSYKEAATFVFSPWAQYALISSNNLILNGGLGSPLPRDSLTSPAIKEWELQPKTNSDHTVSYSLQIPTITPLSATLVPFMPQWISQNSNSDVRPFHKDFWSSVADPVDVVTGAFYVDEADLILPGPFSLAIRRNYSSQNLLVGHLGYGWKLSLNPFLIEEDGKRFASELDGTVIVYRYCPETLRWEVLPEDNPELPNFSQSMTQCSPYHAYMEDGVLYSADGSRRFFENGLLNKWVDANGNQLSFFYNDRNLSRIESSSGDFCGFHYNHEGLIREIYAKDGRRISYEYSPQQDLVKIILPNTGVIRYEYDRAHRVLREIKPHGSILENLYDAEGRVFQQKSSVGPQERMEVTANFDYSEGFTTVTDAMGGKTIYKIFEKKIYKIIDPLGATILQSWFIDQRSWFDPEIEQLRSWDQPGGAVKSLKSTTDKRGLSTHYFYDARGNLERIEFRGKDLTGDGKHLIVKNLAYNDRNLCIEEKVLGKKTLFIYDETFPYLPRRIEKYSEETQTSYLELSYNTQGLIEKEDLSGRVTLWEYNSRGLPRQKTQLTGTEDPGLITTYAYNLQGQCIEIVSPDGVQESVYDLMGNLIESRILSPTRALLSASFIGYDLNNLPIWEQTANTENITYFDYTSSRQLKAKRKQLSPSRAFAYTLYEYNSRGDLIEETDPMGYTTYREYNKMAQLISETKADHTTSFTYEPGGLQASITSPSGAKTLRSYTTNGLLKEEIFADGTKNSIVYDLFGRPISETKNDLSWNIEYDDVHRKVFRTQLGTNFKEITEFDAWGNVIRFTDTAGYTSEKSYDALNRVKTETTPSGKKTFWNYQDNLVICTSPNGEITTERYEGGKCVHSEVRDSEGALIAESSFHYDPEKDIEKVVQGNIITISQLNSLGQPIEIQKGESITSYVYDFKGNCIASTDGDGRTTLQQFDAFGRLIQKELSDGSQIRCDYDLDSNLSEYHLPNGNVWKASYDSMGKKRSEELFSPKGSSGRWTFSYENGYLISSTDPMERTHTYFYDSQGKIWEDIVDGGKRTYTYDPRGFLATVDQTTGTPLSWLSSWLYDSQSEHSRVERTYDADGNLDSESIYLDSRLIQQTKQTWSSSGRVLEIGDHKREFTYRNRRLAQISSRGIDLFYEYDSSGQLKSKLSPAGKTTFEYTTAGLPEIIQTQLPGHSYEEILSWYPSGKLLEYASPKKRKQFTYTERGQLQTADQNTYEFDFGLSMTGIRTTAPESVVSEEGLDAFGRVISEKVDGLLLKTDYNPMGQVILQEDKQFEWDVWGNLINITAKTFVWEASYDAFGRRLETKYTPTDSPTSTSTSLYDPNEEFREIGIKQGEKTFWKIYGPRSCDAVQDESGSTIYLIHNALGELEATLSSQGLLFIDAALSPYGPQSEPTSPSLDLFSYAESLSWHSRSQDPTGLIWMGARYYDPRTGRFLSPDPVSYPLCLDLYGYADGDPVNYLDLDGRFASPVYEALGSNTLMTSASRSLVNGAIAWATDNGLTASRRFTVDGFSIPGLEFGWVNGIQNSYAESVFSAQYLSQLGGGVKISGVYNAMTLSSFTDSPFYGLLSKRLLSFGGDVLKCALSHLKIILPPARLLQTQWTEFFLQNGPDSVFVQFCHSGGGGQVKSALLATPEWIRKKIVVVAFAPSAIIPQELCLKSYNYMSKRDLVTCLDVEGMIKYRNELIMLDPHPEAPSVDHGFLSPTFTPLIRRHFEDSKEQFGRGK